MIFLKLDTLETANELSKICERYKEDMDVDIIYGRQVIDGRSVLGVVSLLGNIIKIAPITKDEKLMSIFFDEIKGIGAYKI